MYREPAEIHLRLLAEAELHCAMKMPMASLPGRWHSARLALPPQALTAVGAAGADVAGEIQADVGLAVTARHQFVANGPRPGTHPAGTPPGIVAGSVGGPDNHGPRWRRPPRGACRGLRAR